MPNPIAVPCPNCGSGLEVRPEDLGREMTCGRCRHGFVPSPGDVPGPPPADRVEVECPGCLRSLKVRLEYLGRTIVCNRCERPFVARVPAEVKPWPGPAGAVDDRPGWEGAVAPLAGRLDALEGRMDRLDRADSDRGASLESLAGRGRDALEALRADLGAIRADLGRLEAGAEADRAALGSGLDRARDASVAEAGRLREGFEAGLRDLGGRLDALDAEARRDPGWRGRVDEALAGLEGARLDQDRALEGHRGEAEAAREALGGEVARLAEAQAPLLRLADELAGWRGRVDQSIGRLEADGPGRDRALDAHRAGVEAALGAIREEFGRLRDRPEATAGPADGPADGDPRLDEVRAEVERIRAEGGRDREARREAEAAARDLRREFERFRDEQALLLRAALDSAEATRSELAALRGEAGRRAPRPEPAEVPAGPATRAPIAEEARPPLDLLALDLAFDQLAPRPPGGPATPPAVATRPGPEEPGPRAEYERKVAQFAAMMRGRPPAEVIPTARELIDYTRERFGDRSSEHALSLRNLAVLLPSQGAFAPARELLIRAREICREALGVGHPSYGICLVDLAELEVLGGDRSGVRDLCDEALAIFRRTVGPDHTLSARARNCLARLAEGEATGRPDFGSVSILT